MDSTTTIAADLAKELVYSTLPQATIPVTLDDIAYKYSLTRLDLFKAIKSDSKLKAAIRREKTRANELGHRAGHVFRVEGMLAALSERLYQRLMVEKAPLCELIKAYSVLSRSVGLDALPPRE
jgi:hypothetical protein